MYIGDFINRIVLGKAWPEDDPNWIYLRKLAVDGSKKFAIATPLSVLPILKLENEYYIKKENINNLYTSIIVNPKHYINVDT